MPALRPPARTTTAPARPDDASLLARFLLLSMLLHVLVVVLFGTAPGGRGNRGELLRDTLSVTLRPLAPDFGAGIRLAPGAATTTPGSALLGTPAPAPRVRASAGPSSANPPPPARAPKPSAVPPPEAPSARPPAAPVAPAPKPPATAPSPPTPVAPATAPSPPVPPPAFEVLPRLNLKAPEIVNKPFVPERPHEATQAPAAPPSRRLSPREVPFVAPAPLERIAPIPRRELAAPIEPPPREVPFVAPAPLAPIAPEAARHEILAPLPAPREEVPAPVPAPRPALAPAETEVPGPTPAPAAAPTPEGVVPAAPGGAVAEPGAQAARPASGSPAGEPLPERLFGAPEVNEDLFRPRTDTRSPAPAGEPHLDLEAIRRRAGEIAREGAGPPAVLNLVPPPPKEARKVDLGEEIAKAAKPDCRHAYADLGLLAIPPLIVSTIGNGGCRW